MNDGGSVCKPQAEAFCTDIRPGADAHHVRCVATMADCEELARNFAGMGPSQCAAVPGGLPTPRGSEGTAREGRVRDGGARAPC